MTTKSILVIGDSVIGGVKGYSQSGMFKGNTLGLSLNIKAIAGTALTDWFRPADGALWVSDIGTVDGIVTADYSSIIEDGHDYIMVSLLKNDIIQMAGKWSEGAAVTEAHIVADYLAFIDHLHTTHGYAYQKILFHFGYLLSEITDYDVDYNEWTTALYNLLKPVLEALGVTIIDEYAYSIAHPNGGDYYISKYSLDNLHPNYKTMTSKDDTDAGRIASSQLLTNEWAANLVGIIKEAIRNH